MLTKYVKSDKMIRAGIGLSVARKTEDTYAEQGFEKEKAERGVGSDG